jgi:RNA polymerase sigma-70 factor (ECF subfamily)
MTGNGSERVNIPDEVLVQNFLDGSDIAYVNLYNRYKRQVYVFALRMLGESDGAKDVVSGVFLKVYERRVQLEHADRFKSWLFAIARNDCLSYLRKEGITTRIEEEYEDTTVAPPSNDAETAEEAQLLAQAIARLKPEHREVIILREYEGMSYREIAEVLNESENVVKSRLFAARQQLYQYLRPILVEGEEP